MFYKCFFSLIFFYYTTPIFAEDKDIMINQIEQLIAAVEIQYSEGLITQSFYLEQISEFKSLLETFGVSDELENLDNKYFSKESENTDKKKIISFTDQDPPMIFLPEIIMSTKLGQVNIDGYVNDDSKVQEIIFDDNVIRFDPLNENSFSFSYYVPPKGTKVLIQAIDQWGNIGSKTIKLSRPKITVIKDIYFDLNPFALIGKKKNDSLAIIIGVEEYKNTFPAPFAKNDAQLFYDFASNIIGIPPEKITLLINEEVTLVNTIKTIRKLKGKINKNKTDIYLFFSGHGLASTEDNDVYLFPHNGDPEVLDISALKRNEIFQQISDYEPASVTVFLDTCYSGATRSNELLIASAKPIFLEVAPTTIPPNFTLISAAANNQIASSLDEAKHGLFSYFLMQGLQGKADSNNDKKITNEEIYTYVATNVEIEAFNLGRTQTPQIIGDSDKILVEW